jgi:hypothetical protein
MRISTEELGKHYASMSDGEIEDINPADLTEIARNVYESERKRRNLAQAAGPRQEDDDLDPDEAELALEAEEEPDWLEQAACACSFQNTSHFDNAQRAIGARDALLASGIPCHVSVGPPDSDPETPEAPQFTEYRVMVPAGLNLVAASVLDKEIFNDNLEESWRTHFASLSDEELQDLTPEVICAGLLDRVERLKQAYEDEVAKRRG